MERKPHTDAALQEAEKQNCFYELFVPMSPAYLTYNINLLNDLANGTLIRQHSLAFDDPEEKQYLNRLIGSTPAGGIIDLPQPPTAINVELYPDFPGDSQQSLIEKQKKTK